MPTDAQAVRVMVIGTLPPPVGGAGVSLQHLVRALGERGDIRVILVNTSGVRGRPWTAAFRFAAIVWRVLTGAARADVVSLQAAPSGLPYIGPFAWAAARLFRRPLMIRLFGGESFLDGRGLRAAMKRWLIRRCDMYLVQTRALADEAHRSGLRRVEWYATSRPMPVSDSAADKEAASRRQGRSACRRFVFVGHVKPLKGIDELIAAAERLEEPAEVDVYGPLMDGVTQARFTGLRRVRYRGEIAAGGAVEVLRGYDAMVFPSYWPGEGYPGVIIEAFSAGLPVIATRWMNIPELVDDMCGILIAPRDASALQAAMSRLMSDAALYELLRQGAIGRRTLFDSRRWVDRFVELCHELRGGPCPARRNGSTMQGQTSEAAGGSATRSAETGEVV
jgi:glycosyltransferase involved in cell wall biosynthesis